MFDDKTEGVRRENGGINVEKITLYVEDYIHGAALPYLTKKLKDNITKLSKAYGLRVRIGSQNEL